MLGLDDRIASFSDWVVRLGRDRGRGPARPPPRVRPGPPSGRDDARRGRAGARRPPRRCLGLVWGLGHATTLFLFGVPILLVNGYLPERVQQGAEIRRRDRDRRAGPPAARALGPRRPPDARAPGRPSCTYAAGRVLDRARARDGRERRRRRADRRVGAVAGARAHVARPLRRLHGGVDGRLSTGFGRTLVSRPVRATFNGVTRHSAS